MTRSPTLCCQRHEKHPWFLDSKLNGERGARLGPRKPNPAARCGPSSRLLLVCALTGWEGVRARHMPGQTPAPRGALDGGRPGPPRGLPHGGGGSAKAAPRLSEPPFNCAAFSSWTKSRGFYESVSVRTSAILRDGVFLLLL